MPDHAMGLYFDEMCVGNVYTHPIRKTITQTDALLFSALSAGLFAFNIPEDEKQEYVHERVIDVGLLAIGYMYGIGVEQLTLGTTNGSPHMSDVRLVRIVRVGDTLHAESEVLDKNESEKCSEMGTIEFETRAYNQRNEVVAKFRCLRVIKRSQC